MSWNIGEHRFPQTATFWEVREKKEKYAIVSISTSRKDKEGNWFNSNWGFTRFVGNAINGLDELEPKDRIEILSGNITSEPYVNKDGERVYPKTPQIVVFAWKRYVREEQESGGNDTPPVVEEDDSNEELPF